MAEFDPARDSDPGGHGLMDQREFSESLSQIKVDDQGTPAPEGEEPSEAQLEEPGDDPSKPGWVGKTLGRFKLLGSLGEGAMGLVIRAQDVHLGRIVALKVLRKRIKGMDDRQRVEQFLREARAAAQINHPNVAHIFEINEFDGWWYVATELIEGGTLRDAVKVTGKLSPAQACPFIADAAQALAVAHQLGITHRDVKPRNLMLTRSGRCKVVDFGLVRIDDPNDPFDFTSHAVGTPLYLAPEAMQKAKPSGAMDVYSLGASLYYALTGGPPFIAKDLKSLVKLHAEADRPDVRERNSDCSEALSLLIQRAMAIDPAERPNAADFASALRVETIGSQATDAMLDPGGSSIIARIQVAQSGAELVDGSQQVARSGAVAVPGSATAIVPPRTKSTYRSPAAVVAAFIVVLSVAAVIAWQSNLIGWGGTVQPREAFMDRFADAPATYGSAPSAPAGRSANLLTDPPPFSWRHTGAPEGAQFVAHRDGQNCYSINDPLASLIDSGAAVFYDSEEEAAADGRIILYPR